MVLGAIFDMDGLLLDSEAIWQKHWNILADEMGIELPEDFKHEICGTSGDLLLEVLKKYYPADRVEEILETCKKRAYKDMDEGIPLKKGAKEILEFLKEKNLKLAVASASPLERIEMNLNNVDVLDYFDVRVSGWQVENGKPAPDIFLKATEELGIAPENCYVFEDAYNGIHAAHAAGCKPIMVPDLSQPDEEMKELCVGIYDSLLDAKEALEETF